MAVHSGTKPSLCYSNWHFISFIKSVHVIWPSKVPLYANELAAVLIFYCACLAGNAASLNPLSTRRERESQTLYYNVILPELMPSLESTPSDKTYTSHINV